jgi:hypothetical protein
MALTGLSHQATKENKMAIDYSKYITNDQKKELIKSRLAQFATEAYQHSINAQVAQSLGNDEGVENAASALAILEAAIDAHEAELTTLA